MPSVDLLREAGRHMSICNACRYCEGYCAVFPAMELRRTFSDGDLLYLANLCFDCRACLYACQYAPPHAFNMNVPAVMAEMRTETYKSYSWPGVMRRVLDRNLSSVLLVTLAATVAVFLALSLLGDPARLTVPHTGPGAFYEVAPYATLVATATAIVVYGIVVFAVGVLRFWRDTRSTLRDVVSLPALWKATTDAFDLSYLKGGGNGCYYPADRRSQARRLFHGLVFYGFLADLASTTLAAIYQDVFEILPPYPILSPVVLLGTVGGIGLVIGTVGLAFLKWRSDKTPTEGRMTSMDLAFLVMLNLSALTGLALLAFRDSAGMGVLFALHLGVVTGLFITLPYGKFAHVIYRYAALIQNGIEQRRVALTDLHDH